ncbi:UDP-N-acetylenolpyruvoylglucosamine reductase [Capsulimonas corticalis]|uniref:UDP-N-acetylenolpyruvoylglucosamine reductase n=1 Tax=Capsulimonas corticalis TaxID=2219043 RepID=A0A402CRN4_9BACT|nr:UDP-N-acetylmuramate dehydrogenase [Capsulimonas corticalis]BDI28113.1 UDP-N-acetylenolpyruvoylglucosamine reductase [Capsulimonas corticalis]
MTTDLLLRAAVGDDLLSNEPMSRHTTLKVGGPARWFWAARDVDDLSRVLTACTEHEIPYLFIGHGSNLLMSDAGYDGLVIQNRCKGSRIGAETYSESGVSFGSLFYQTAREGFSGLEWAIGIPGTVGGALVSNAGAYRGNIGPLVRSVRVFADGRDQEVGPEWMEFSYRDSRLRRSGIGRTVILSCMLHFEDRGDPETIIARAKDYQAQRRAKQPYAPSAGSFFKNVTDKAFAQTLPDLPDALKAAGVVPSGFLIEACGLKGLQVGGAQASEKHANFLINAGGATASDLRRLAYKVKGLVHEKFGVTLEEEVLYVGDWSEWTE